ncbi:MAG: tetratricopeptide repeat protein [Thermoanaerobaculia bacterium]
MRSEIQDALDLGRADRWNEAIAKMKVVVEDEPTAENWAYLGTTYRSCCRWEEADAAYARALAADAGHVGALWGLGLSRGMQGDTDGAAEMLGRAVGAAPRFAPPRFQLALTLLERGDETGALRHADVVRALDARYAAKLDAILRERGLLPL